MFDGIDHSRCGENVQQVLTSLFRREHIIETPLGVYPMLASNNLFH